jgi:pimeloyl-ACP methyl ester carboxylesterase
MNQLTEAQLNFLQRRAPIRRIPPEKEQTVRLQVQGEAHAWLETGPETGPVILFAHGLMGNIYNTIDFFEHFARQGYRMMMPFLPMYDLPLEQTRVAAVGQYLEQFATELELDRVVLVGNSTGGGAGVCWAAEQPQNLSGLVLIGSSGLSNKPLQTAVIRRNDWNFMYENMRSITVNKDSVRPEMIDDVFQATQQFDMAIRILRLVKSVLNEKLHDEAGLIRCPTLLCWGDSDIVTPPSAAGEFQRLIPHAELHWFANCGHLPQMEQPAAFCETLELFLAKINYHPNDGPGNSNV